MIHRRPGDEDCAATVVVILVVYARISPMVFECLMRELRRARRPEDEGEKEKNSDPVYTHAIGSRCNSVANASYTTRDPMNSTVTFD